MLINYDSKHDLLYIRLDSRKQQLMNRRVTDDLVLDIGEDDKIVGIEIMDASMHINLQELLPAEYALKQTV
jgi:uncharacterized protein YuzE